jgi:hypothetical protein
MARDDGFIEVVDKKTQPKPQRTNNRGNQNQNNRRNQNNQNNNRNQNQNKNVKANIQSSTSKSAPQKSSMAGMLNSKPANLAAPVNYAGTAMPKLDKKEVSIEEVHVKKDMTRSYELTRSPPEGFQTVLKRQYPSMDVCVVNDIIFKEKALPSLFLHFNAEHPKGNSDWERAANLTMVVQGITIRLQAATQDKTDAEGILIPKFNRMIYATGVPFSLARNPQIIKDFLSEFVEFDEENSFKMIYEDGMYRGQVVVPVADYHSVPPFSLNMPFFTMNAFGSFEQVPKATCKIGLVCKGVDPSMKPSASQALGQRKR